MMTSEPFTIFPRVVRSGKTIYYFQYRKTDGTRSTAKSTGCSSMAAAKRFCNELYNSGAFGSSDKIFFTDYTKDFFSTDSRYYKWKLANKEKITFETLLAYDKFLRNQLLPYFENFELDKIRRADIKEWVIWANSKWSSKTVNSAQTVLNLIFKQAIDDEILEYNPAAGLTFRTIEKKERQLLTIPEIRRMYNSLWWYDNKTIFLLSVCTGMRISEIVALRKENIYKNYLDVKHSYSRAFGLGETKTGIARFIPVPEQITRLLHSDYDYIFVNHEGKNKGKPLNINSFYCNIVDVYNSCKINYKQRNLDVHTNRNFFISYLQSQNVPEPKIRAVVGHKDNSMTNLYTYWKPEMFPEVYEAQEKLCEEIICE